MLKVNNLANVKIYGHPGALASQTKSKTYTHDECLEFISELIKLLGAGIYAACKKNSSQSLATQIISIMERLFNISAIYQNNLQEIEYDIAERIKPALLEKHEDIKHAKKTVLKLCRRIITTIQNHQHRLSIEMSLVLNKIESLIEEKIVAERDNQFPQSINHHLYDPKPGPKTQQTQSNYTQYCEIKGYKLSITKNINSNTKYSKAAHISKGAHTITHTNHAEHIDIITIDSKPIENFAQLDLLESDALNRLKVEANISGSQDEINEIKTLLRKIKKSKIISPEDSIQIDKIIRPAKIQRVHVVYLSDDCLNEHSLINRAKEAFIIGAKLFVLSTLQADKSIDSVCHGVELINSLLDKDIHPDKIVLLCQGPAMHVGNKIKTLFLKQGIDITQINYQKPGILPTLQPTCICSLRTLNIFDSDLYTKKAAKNLDCPAEYKAASAHLSRHLKKGAYDHGYTNLADAHLKAFSLIQLINLFLKTTQHFIQNNPKYANPALPLERVRVIELV